LSFTKEATYWQPKKYRLEFWDHTAKNPFTNSVEFDGVDDQIDCGNWSDLWSKSLTKFSWSVWVYPTAIGDVTRDIMRHGNTGGGRFRCDINSGNGNVKWYFRNNADSADAISQASGLVLNKWQHIVGTYDNSLGSANIKVYLNGVLGATTANDTEAKNLSRILTLAEGSTDFKGRMKDFRFWDTRALTQTEIDGILAGNENPVPDYWLPLNQGTEKPTDIMLLREAAFLGGAYWGGFFFDSDSPDPEFQIHDCVLKLNTFMHELTFTIDNSAGNIDSKMIQPGNVVYIQVWKNSEFKADSKSWCFTGEIDFPSEGRKGFEAHEYKVRVIELKDIFYNSNLNFKRTAPVDELGKVQTATASKFEVWKIIKDMVDNKRWSLLGDASIKSRIPFLDTDTLVDKEVKIIYPRARFIDTSAGTALDELADLIGFNWYLDYIDGVPFLVIKYPYQDFQKIVLKAGDTKDISGDAIDTTSYITEIINKSSSSRMDANVATRITAVSKIENFPIALKNKNVASTGLNRKAIAQPFTALETNFSEIQLTLSKIGDPTSPQERVNGRIYVNVNNKPVGRVLDFEISLSDIEETPTNVTVDLQDNKRQIKSLVGISNYYIVLYQRSGITGDPNDDVNNMIRWHRDTATNGGSLQAAEGDRALHDKLVWKADGPNYMFSIKSNLNRRFIAQNQEMIKKIGYLEPPSIDFGFIEDVNTAQRYLASILYYASLYKVPIPLKVTMPNNFLFKPYMTIPGVTVNKIFPFGIDLEIQEVEYNFAENTNECSLVCLAHIDENFPNTFGCVNLT